MQFLRAYSSITIELARLLDVRFVPGDEAHLGHTGAALARVMLLNNKGDHLRRDWELNRLMLLINDLQLLEKRRHDLFLLFRTKLQDPDVHRYFGSRHELGTAVAFLERDIPFKFELPARPDFVIDEAPDAAGIECTSSHLTQIKSVDLAYKVQSTLHAKAAKPYANSNTALSVEATSLQSVALRDNKLVFGFESDSAIADIASRSPFGRWS